ncbi:MAG: glycerol-3-phosphate acyltransferase [Chloroflexi bacterium]|nr:MAG: glycerol-3-phosphate acyltransferase [Chloroflexota bacterium]
MTLAVVLVVAYLLGSIPTSYIVVLRATGRDIRTMGSGNPGTMNVLDSVGWKAAGLVAVGDIAKGVIAVVISYQLGFGDVEAVLAATAAVIGHDYSIFLRFDGGNGTAAVIGGLVALMPLETLGVAAIGIGLGVLVGSRRLGGLVALMLLPPLAYANQVPEAKLLGAVALMGLTVLKIIRFEGFSAARPGR